MLSSLAPSSPEEAFFWRRLTRVVPEKIGCKTVVVCGGSLLILERRHRYSNCCQTVNQPDNSGRHLLVCSQNQYESLHILHHAPFLQLSNRCVILMNLTFGLLPHSPPSNSVSSPHCSLLPIVHSTIHCQAAPPVCMRPWVLCQFVLHCIVLRPKTPKCYCVLPIVCLSFLWPSDVDLS